MPMSHRITYVGIGSTVKHPGNKESLLDISIANKIPHLHECGGNGKCTTCRIRVVDGSQNLNPPTPIEVSTSKARKWDPTIRLACQTYPDGDVKIQRLVWSSAEVNQLQKELAPEGKAEERKIAILFCDLRNFTSLSTDNLNFDLAFMLNRFYTALGDPILMNNGIIYQYVGDEIIGVFGTTGGTPEKICMDAIRAGIGMEYALRRLNKTELRDLDITLESGIGINYGPVFLGHLGHPTHRQFSVIGDPVNVASRIQDHTKVSGTQILLSESTLQEVNATGLHLGKSLEAQLKGKEELVKVHELLGFKEMDLQLELQASVHILLSKEDDFAGLFYQKVFSLAPLVRELFKKSMIDQGRLLTHMIGGIVYALSRPAHLTLGLKKLGYDHLNYGVKAEYYPVVKQAMLETIEETLIEEGALGECTKLAWETAMDFIIDAMLKGAQEG